MEAETTEVVIGECLPPSEAPIAESVPVDTSDEGTGSGGGEADAGGVVGFLTSLSTCGSCKEPLHNRQPKLLSCLHTFCWQCISLLDTDDARQLKCPTCLQMCPAADLIDNVFVPALPLAASHNSSGADDTKICTGCEENVAATYYCVECSEWLCDQCEQAHRRVKVTKDHTIETKENAPRCEERRELARNQQLPCPVHPQEALKLYCNTCSKLTCRDCQLVEHKEHKYQFLQEAAHSYKEYLQNLLNKIKEKQTYIENAKSLIDQRNREIIQKEQAVIQEVKHFAMSLITDINLKGRQLITDLQSICSAKKRQLEQKDREIQLLSSNLEHSLKFAEYLLQTGDDTELLYSRKALATQLRHILQTRCEVPNPYHVVDLRFVSSQSIAAAIPKLGCIVVDGVPFSSRSGQPSATASSGSSSVNGFMSGISSSTSRPLQNSGLLGTSGTSQSQGQPVLQHAMTNDQKMALLLSMRKSFDRQRRQQQMKQQMLQQQQQQQQIMQQQQSYLNQQPTTSRHDYGGFGTQRLTHLPNQSANISSTNLGHQQKAQAGSAGLYYPSSTATQVGGYSSPTQPTAFPGNQICLAQLQMRRQSDAARNQGSSSLQPIVIQPTGPYQPPSPISQHLAADSLQENSVSFTRQMSGGRQPYYPSSTTSSVKVEASERPSCSMIKQEAKGFNLDFLDLRGSASISGSRTPTPCIESTELELLNETSPNLSAELFSSGAGASASNDSDKPLSNWAEMASDSSSGLTGGEYNQHDQVSVALGDTLSLLESSSSSPLPDVLRMRSADDPSDDYCAVCRNGGDLLCCDGCPKVFHFRCHVLQLTDAPSTMQWYCGLCTKAETIRMESPDNRQAISTGLGTKRRSTAGLTPREQKVCERLLLELFCHEASMPFHEPVSKSVPNYYRTITNPMDFSTIRSKLSKNNFHHYQCLEDFIADVRVVFANCQKFNHPETEIGKAGRKVEEFFDVRVGQLLPFFELRSITPQSDQSETRPRTKRRRLNGSVKPGGKKSSLSSGEGDASLDGEEESCQMDVCSAGVIDAEQFTNADEQQTATGSGD